MKALKQWMFRGAVGGAVACCLALSVFLFLEIFQPGSFNGMLIVFLPIPFIIAAAVGGFCGAGLGALCYYVKRLCVSISDERNSTGTDRSDTE